MGLLLIVGATLAKVHVYTGASELNAEPRVTFIETVLMHKRRLMEVGVDFTLIWASYVIAHALRFDGNLAPDLEVLILKSLPWIILVKTLCFFSCGLYRGVWRYISLPDLVNILRAVVMSSVLSAFVVLYLWRFEGYSRAVFVIDGLLLFVSVSGSRRVEPLFNEWITASVAGATPILNVGAGDTGAHLLQQLKHESSGRRRVVGFLDDDVTKQGDSIHGIRILGSRQELGRVVQELGVREVLIAMRRPPPDLIQQIQGYCEENGLSWRVVDPAIQGEPLSPREA
jgi:UDP-GlcNAc:undecaprenyl-phosphate GlcNAc-1-phosphate transferase